jgi:hypothetical protein
VVCRGIGKMNLTEHGIQYHESKKETKQKPVLSVVSNALLQEYKQLALCNVSIVADVTSRSPLIKFSTLEISDKIGLKENTSKIELDVGDTFNFKLKSPFGNYTIVIKREDD